MNRKIISLLNDNVPLVLATIVAYSGSVPRKTGAKMLISPDGPVAGSVGGGSSEAATLEAAKEILQSGIAAFRHFELRPGEVESEAESICGGAVDIFIEPLSQDLVPQFEQVLEVKSGFWRLDITNPIRPERVFCPDRDSIIPGMDLSGIMLPGIVRNENADGGAYPPVGGLELAQGDAAKFGAKGGRVFYVEEASSEHIVLICGGGHIALALSALLPKLDFSFEVAENREEFASPERFPAADSVKHLPEFADLAETFHISYNHYVVVVTHGHKHDFTVLEQALHTRARYIGMIGSRSKRDAIYNTLNENGMLKAELACVCCPIGLDIGGQTPEEIAISIAAELIAARSGRLHGKRR